MKIEKAYLVGIHRHSFRAGEPAEIIGFNICIPYKQGIVDIALDPRACYKIQFSDGTIDYVQSVILKTML